MPVLPLKSGSVDIWMARVLPDTAAHVREFQYLLSFDERQRLGKFVAEAPRMQYLTARAALRLTLSRYAHIAPQAWTFTANSYGKPRIAAPRLADPLHFNVSHCDGQVAIAVSRHHDIGVDVENVTRRLDIDQLAPAVLAQAECDALARAPETERQRLFFTFWTLKEAYVKARGMGLSLNLKGFAFETCRTHPHVSFNELCPDVASRWSFRSYAVGQNFALALAAPSSAANVQLHHFAAQDLMSVTDA